MSDSEVDFKALGRLIGDAMKEIHMGIGTGTGSISGIPDEAKREVLVAAMKEILPVILRENGLLPPEEQERGGYTEQLGR